MISRALTYLSDADNGQLSSGVFARKKGRKKMEKG